MSISLYFTLKIQINTMVEISFIMLVFYSIIFIFLGLRAIGKKNSFASTPSKPSNPLKGRKVTHEDYVLFCKEYNAVTPPTPEDASNKVRDKNLDVFFEAWKERQKAIENDPNWEINHQRYLEEHKEEIERKKKIVEEQLEIQSFKRRKKWHKEMKRKYEFWSIPPEFEDKE